MPSFPGLRRVFRIDRDAATVDRAVDDELQFHFDMTVRELVAAGMTPDQARTEAEHRFGDVQRTREGLAAIDRARAGQERRAEWWSAFVQDLRYAIRGLRLKPGFALAVIVTLGLGIGANATMFGIVDRLLFRPPAFLLEPARVNRIYFATTSRGKEAAQTLFDYRSYLDLKENTTSFDAMAPFYVYHLAIGTGDATKEMDVGIGGADLWKLFAVKPVIGRFFTADEDLPPSGTRVVVLSYAFWQTQFGGRASAIGESIDIGPGRYTIIGVAPEEFNGFSPDPVVAFVPNAAYAGLNFVDMGGSWYGTYDHQWFYLFSRRKPGISAAAATADLTRAKILSYRKEIDAYGTRIASLAIAKPRAFVGPVLADRGPNEADDAKVATWLAGVAAIVLLIACANVANLLLARALERRREIAVRIALGVTRARLLMQLVTESVLLATLGGLTGLAIARWGGAAMRHILLQDAASGPSAFGDARLLIPVAALTLAAGLLTALAPVFQTHREDVTMTLKAGSRSGATRHSRLRGGLLIGQAALSVVLLIGAGLFLRSLINVKNVRMGYDADRLLYVELNLRGVKVDPAHNALLRQELLERAQKMPAVDNATRALTVPFWQTWQFPLFVAGIDSVRKLGNFTLQAGSPEFFATTGTRILRGRGISTEDRSNTPSVVVVGESMAKRLWPNADAIGRCIRILTSTAPCSTVVGIAEDIRRGSMRETDMHYYLAIAQFYAASGGLFIRTHGPAVPYTNAVRRALQPLMPGASYITVTPMSTIIAPQIRSWKIGAIMFTAFGLLALMLAAIGLYSVIGYNVVQRTHEMGIRMALGAETGDVTRLIVREGLKVVVPGVVLGTVIALLAGRWIAPLLFNVSPKDPPVLAGVVMTLIAVAIVASWVPARRAARVDPTEALRAD